MGHRNYLFSPLGPQGCPSGAQVVPNGAQSGSKGAQRLPKWSQNGTKMEPKLNTFNDFLHILDQQAAVLATKTVTLMSVAISDGMDNI